MGGYGSGRSTGRGTTGGALAIDLARLRAAGRRSGDWSWSLAGMSRGSVSWALTDEALILRYGRREENRSVPCEDRLRFVSTEAGFGGQRQWLACPCGRRCRVVYVGQRGTRCRRCYNLAYQSQREDASQRAQRRALRLVLRVGGSSEDPDWPPKPKGMHWSTYCRLEDEHEWLVLMGETALLARIGRMVGVQA